MAAPQIKGDVVDTDQVLVEEKGCVRVLTLNRPRQLNALSSQMILKLLKLFTAYEKDPTAKLLIMKGKGRAFCAGSDVSAVTHSITQGHWTNGANVFWNQYILDYIIATYSKPQVSFLNGFVMGGGAGVSIHGRFRVATEKSVFAMPETALGCFPDVGASYFLSRLRGYFGEYVGLTGTRLDGAEMLACGLATHFVPSTRLDLLEESFVKLDSFDSFTVCRIIDQFSEHVLVRESSAYNRLDVIDRCFSKTTVEEILSAVEQEVVHWSSEWILTAIELLKKASPINLKVALRSIREGQTQQVGQCLVREYRMCCHILRKDFSKDFFEGCRAILVDKDRNPKWEPSRLDQIDDDMVDKYFSKVDDAGWEELKLPGGHDPNILSKI
ncbi:3-hydroxyisobutyryl-CoA hydrolase 1-like [Asparagus officinalis]|uniref:3-hydroxyisobutyryl-CoA hydrolase 1-like n=1 Tax=Asparagus officinalis TaxID=4686 RepID=UPI00098E1AC3|nr:3-hydroxyisobutyryl-CoA hydrolase 1-like [Asparagus officinalis]